MSDDRPEAPVARALDPVAPWGSHPGMTLRDWFAGQALIGACMEVARAGEPVAAMRAGIAKSAYQVADAMIAARKL